MSRQTCPSVRLSPTPSSSWKREIVNLSVGRVEIPDEGGSNPVVLVAPVKGFPLKPREQLPDGLEHIRHRGHDRGNNHLGNNQQSVLWQQSSSPHLLLSGLHRLHAHLVEEASSFARETERDVLEVLLNTPLVRICLIAFQTVWVEPGRDCSGSFEEVRETQG